MKPKGLLDASDALVEASLADDWSILPPFVPDRVPMLVLVANKGHATYEQLGQIYGLFKPDEMHILPITGPFTVSVRLRWHT